MKGKLGKGTKEQSKPAVGGKGVVAHENRVLWVDTNGEAWTRDATVSSLPSLFLQLGKIWSAVDLYGYWNRCQLLLVKRPHAWPSPDRRLAAVIRHQETGHYGFRT